MRRLLLYGRAGCCLCEEARAALLRAQARHPFELVERDIESDERLLRAYLERIPVVTIDGEEAFQFFVDEAALERLLARSDGRASQIEWTADELHGRARRSQR